MSVATGQASTRSSSGGSFQTTLVPSMISGTAIPSAGVSACHST
jgi:hypothetical protein